jgi:hypothetical protein
MTPKFSPRDSSVPSFRVVALREREAAIATMSVIDTGMPAGEAEEEKLMDVYAPIMFVDYEVPSEGPEIPRLERLDYLDHLYQKNEDFLVLLKANHTLRYSFLEGLQSGART